MKQAVLFVLFVVTPAFAQAPDKPLCVDASRNSNYNARPISLHEVLARNSTGDLRGVRLSTTCIHIDRAASIGLHSLNSCIAQGDDVAVSVPGGPSEQCKISGVSKVPEDYAAAKYKY
jgi:hypothetical protein